MNGLSIGDWSLIARFLKEEASKQDVAKFQILVKRYPELSGELEMLGREMNSPRAEQVVFDTETAFGKLDERFKEENLV